MVILSFVSGLALLIVGAEILVRGASRLAEGFGVSPLVVGLTVVAFGTSSPELAVSVGSALAGQSEIALGNVVGSNIFNVLFILGVSAIIVPLIVAQQIVRLDVPLMTALSVVLLFMALDGRVGRLDGLILVSGLAAYVGFLIRQSRRESAAVREEYAREFGVQRRSRRGVAADALMVVGGLALLVVGSRWLVDGAVVFAQRLGVGEAVIGLTIVAAGTSLPEVVTSIVAAIRGDRDIAVGNVVGSNIFNLMGVLGLAGLVAPSGIEVPASVLRFDVPVMIAVAVACLPITFTGHLISRWEGAMLLGFYVAYTAYLILAAAEHASAPVFGGAMLFIVVPLAASTLAIVTAREIR